MQSHRTLLIEAALVTALAALAMSFGIGKVRVGSRYNADPFSPWGIDESTYGHCAARMVRTGQWATQVYFDHYLLNKPPLSMWAGAASMSLLGVGGVSLRLPVMLAAIAIVVLAYYWLRRARTRVVALAGVVLLCGDPMFHCMSRRFMTDMFLVSACVAAVFVLQWDPRFQSRWSAALFGLFSGCAILSKSAAGLMPFLVLACFWVLAGKDDRPRWRGIGIACLTAAATAAPWHLYQLLVHRDWFVAEYIRYQLFVMGLNKSPESTSAFVFYPQAIWRLDPLLALLSLSALPWLVIAACKRDSGEKVQARLMLAWLILVLAGLAVFQNRSGYYLLPTITVLPFAAAQFSPLFRGRAAWATLAVLLVVFAVKVNHKREPWGINYGRGIVSPSVPELDRYAQLRRTNDLVIVSPDDDFLSIILNLPKVRYAYITPSDDYWKTPAFLYWLGCIMSAKDFRDFRTTSQLYESRLRSWKCYSCTGSLGLVIMARSEQELAEVVKISPERDFSFPEQMRALALSAGGAAHTATPTQAGRFFLLANRSARSNAGLLMPGAFYDIP